MNHSDVGGDLVFESVLQWQLTWTRSNQQDNVYALMLT